MAAHDDLDLAAQWLAANYPDELATFPTEDTARRSHDVSLGVAMTERAGYYEEQVSKRPGTRRNPAWRRREAVDSQNRAIAQAEAGRLSSIEHPCEHCEQREAPKWAKLCRRCSQHFSRHGTLPVLDEATP